jgi:photosystem II stability/assembly factor-like uncharacterized protein
VTTTRHRTLHLTALLLAGTTAAPAQTVEPGLFAGLRYRNIGPTRGGRVTAVTGVPGRKGTFYMGATGGGVWKTTDYGQSWTSVSDAAFLTGSIGAIRTDPTNPDIVYVGTGSDGIRSNVIQGRGIYKSLDAGRTWRLLGLRNAGQIGAVEVHPGNPNVIFAAVLGQPFGPNPERGVYRSRDAGSSWELVHKVSDSTGAVDLEFAPDNAEEVYAAMWRVERKPWTIISGAREGGVWKSSNGGTTWTRLGGGLPTGLVGKADLAVSPAAPGRLYVLIEAEPGGGLYRSDDRGVTFRLVSTENGLLRRPFYYTNVDADPANADVVYVNNEGFFRSADGGRTWQRGATPHGDNHDMWIDPSDPSVWIQSNDGGANVTRDGGRTWSTQDNQPTAELYQVAVDDRFPYWVYAGQQDNTTIAVPSLPPFPAPGGPTSFWRDVGGCETGPAVPKPGDPDIVYSNCKGQFFRYSHRTGQEKRYWVGAQSLYSHNPKDLKYRFQRVVPIHVSPHDPSTVYHASQFLHRTRDEGVTWETISPDLTANEPDKQVISGTPITRDITGEEYYSTIYAVRESPREKGQIWVGANDGPVHVSRNAGRTWTRVTPADLPPGGRVQSIEPSPHRPEKAYLAVYRYLLNDWRPWLYRTTDYGKTWTLLTTGQNGIPADYPTRVVREDPDREGLLYAGTEFGMFISFDDGRHWQPFQLNLPVTPVTDIAVYRKDLVISTMGRSFWILDNVTPLHQVTAQAAAGNRLLAPRETYRFRAPSAGLGPGGVSGFSPGAAIDYYLASDSPGAVLEILDERSALVRAWSATTRTAPTDEEQEMRGPPRGGAMSPGLPTRAGMHRFTWDLTVAGPADESGQPSGRGPMVVPGRYQARLRIGDWNGTQAFTVRADPRVTADGVTEPHLAEQFTLALTVRDALSSLRKTTAQVKALRQRGSGDPAGDATLAAAEAALVTKSGPYPTPMLVDQFAYLYNMLTGADQRPGRDAAERLAELTRQHSELKTKLRAVPGWREEPAGGAGR